MTSNERNLSSMNRSALIHLVREMQRERDKAQGDRDELIDACQPAANEDYPVSRAVSDYADDLKQAARARALQEERDALEAQNANLSARVTELEAQVEALEAQARGLSAVVLRLEDAISEYVESRRAGLPAAMWTALGRLEQMVEDECEK